MSIHAMIAELLNLLALGCAVYGALTGNQAIVMAGLVFAVVGFARPTIS
jgi:uncharacterized membrane protein